MTADRAMAPGVPPGGRKDEEPRAAPGRALAVEVAILALAVAVFFTVHVSVGLDRAVATANAHQLLSIERVLGLDVELAANRWLVDHPVLAVASAAFYRLYYLPFAAVLVWARLRHRSISVEARRLLLVMAVIALLVYWALPMSPPRFSLPGIVDVVTEHDLFPRPRGTVPGEAGPYSAMPSLHVGWSAWCAWTVWAALRSTRPLLARAAWLFPAVMTLVVIGTGAHYVLDVLGTATLLAASVLATSLWRRLRTQGASR